MGYRGLEGSSADGFECHTGKHGFRDACFGPKDYEYKDKRYCILHFPSEEKASDTQFQEALCRKLEARDFDFSGACLPGDLENFQHFEFDSQAEGSTVAQAGEYLRVKQIAEYLSVSNKLVCQWIREGRLKATKLGKQCVRVRRDHFEDFMRRIEEDNPYSAP